MTVRNKMIIKGCLKLKRSILCKEEVLGKEFDAVIGKQSIVLCFPRLPYIDGNNVEIGFNNPLLPYDDRFNWNVEWGELRRYPDIIASIYSIALLIERESSNEDAQLVYDAITEWEYRFLLFCNLLKKEYAYRDKNLTEADSNLQLLGDDGYIQRQRAYTFHCYFHAEDDGLSVRDIQAAVEYASKEATMHLEYEMLLSAYDARHMCDNRKVVLEGSAAVELCLVKQVQKFCSEKGIEEDILLGKYRTLGDRFKLVGKINKGFDAKSYEESVVRLRNQIMHGSVITPSDEVTDLFLKKVEECLAFFHEAYYE